jgi:hypothetical protein
MNQIGIGLGSYLLFEQAKLVTVGTAGGAAGVRQQVLPSGLRVDR